MNTPTRIFLPLLSLAVFSSCKKMSPYPAIGSDGLPVATQDGANVIACKINGVPWIIEFENSTNTDEFTGTLSGDTIVFGGSAKPPDQLPLRAVYLLTLKIYPVSQANQVF